MHEGPIVIIGAGPAGLGAAYELVCRGEKPIVIEQADRVGGLARTEVYKGYLFDLGGHRFYTKNKHIQRIWKDMLGDDFLRVRRISRIYYQGRFFDYPLDPINIYKNLGVVESLLIALSYARAKLRPHPQEKTFEEWVTHRFGWRLYKAFFQPYTEKVWGIPCQEIQADWAAQRIKGLSLKETVFNALLGTQNAKTLVGEFHYPLKGPGMMWQRFQEAIEAGGGEIRLGSRVVSVKHSGGRIVGVVTSDRGGSREIPTRHLISSMPVNRLVAMLEPRIPGRPLEAARGLSYRAFVLVGLILNRNHSFSDQWLYIHDPKLRVGRIQNLKNWSAAMVPDSQTTSLGMEFFCTEGDDIWSLPDARLLDLAAQELAALGLGELGDVIDGMVLREPNAYPVYNRSYAAHLKEIRRLMKRFKNLQTIGRNGMHQYNNMDHSMLTGFLAARNVFGENHDLWKTNEDQEYLEGAR